MSAKDSILDVVADRIADERETSHVSVRLKTKTKLSLEKAAKKRGVSVNRLIAELIEMALEQPSKRGEVTT